MKTIVLKINVCLLLASIALVSQGQNLKEEHVLYYGDGATMKGYIVYDSSTAKKRPAVLVVPEWWGLTDYTRQRARMLAKLGYISMAVDIYGGAMVADNPDSAAKYAMIYYMDPVKAKQRLDAAIILLKQYAQVDTLNMAAIGYCFGGSLVLNAARLGVRLKGAVSFHGSPVGSFHGNTSAGAPLKKELLGAKILVCHGGADEYVPLKDVELFKRQMDSTGCAYTLRIYPGASHAFTNPGSTELGIKFKMPIAYNAKADADSWKDMQLFLSSVFTR